MSENREEPCKCTNEKVSRVSRRFFYFQCTNPDCGKVRAVRKFLVSRNRMVCRNSNCRAKKQSYKPQRTRCECGAYLYPEGAYAGDTCSPRGV